MDQCDVENQGGADHGGLGSQHDDAIKRSPASHEDQQDETAGNNAGEERWNELRIRPFRKEQVVLDANKASSVQIKSHPWK
ncbi:hypothetical protein [Pseudomonas kurunegalensis]|uniref:hypothetical protein n=1 Tax=Pseudomonas kurunegalensis TaxID=485880 RepID=UPI00325FF3B4